MATFLSAQPISQNPFERIPKVRNLVIVILVGVLCAAATTAPARDIVAMASNRVQACATGHAKSIRVKDAHKSEIAKDCSGKSVNYASATVTHDCDCQSSAKSADCGGATASRASKESQVEFAVADCDSVKSVSQKRGKTTVKLASGRQVELRGHRDGTVTVDYDR